MGIKLYILRHQFFQYSPVEKTIMWIVDRYDSGLFNLLLIVGWTSVACAADWTWTPIAQFVSGMMIMRELSKLCTSGCE